MLAIGEFRSNAKVLNVAITKLFAGFDRRKQLPCKLSGIIFILYSDICVVKSFLKRSYGKAQLEVRMRQTSCILHFKSILNTWTQRGLDHGKLCFVFIWTWTACSADCEWRDSTTTWRESISSHEASHSASPCLTS